jgi:small subunit ribosomal protein S18
MPQNHRKQTTVAPKIRVCYFCVNGLNDIDYKDTRILQKFTSSHGKLLPRRRTGTCLKHMRKFSLAVKRARTMALVPFVMK